MDGVIGLVEDIYPEGGGVTLDRGGDVHSLDCVRKLEEELDRLGHVLHMAGAGVVGAVPAGTSSTARREVSRSCRRATVSRPERSVKRGERILMRRPETAGIEAARRNWIFCYLSFASKEGEDAAVGGAGQAERSSRCCEASWYRRPTATHEVGMSIESPVLGRRTWGSCRRTMVQLGGGCDWCSLSIAIGGRARGRLYF
jgi:hypothetical protein